MLTRFPLFGMLLGLAAMYIGERALTDTSRWLVLGVGAVSLVATLVVAILRMGAASGDRRKAYARLVGEYALVILAVLVYYAQTREVALIPSGKPQVISNVVWPALIALGGMPAIAMELALLATAKAPTIELWRVLAGRRAARIIALAFVIFGAVNFTAATWNRKIDLSYFKTSKPGEATIALVQSLTQPVDMFLFFPPGNEVLEHVRTYAESLATASPLLNVRVVDQALEFELARELKVQSNGHVVVRSGSRSEDLRMFQDLEDARGTLRDMDAEVQELLLKVVRPARVAYFTTGHNERDWSPPSTDSRMGLSDLKNLLESLGFTVRRLGLAEGLGNEVPADATLVVIPGPLDPFLPAERTALQNYLARGGRVLGFIDPDRGPGDPDLYKMVGVQVGGVPVATEKYVVRVEGRGESPYDMATTQASVHPSVSTFQKAAGRLYVVFLGAGSVRMTDPPTQGFDVSLVVRAMNGSWEDLDKNGAFDEKTEKRDSHGLIAAVEGKVAPATTPSAAPAAPDKTKPDATPTAMALAQATPPADPHEGHAHGAQPTAAPAPTPAPATPPASAEAKARVIVVGDTDMAANGVLRNPGNAYVLADAVRWLAGDDAVVGKVESERDQPIVHRKDEDTIWFYGTSFIFPALVLGFGLWTTRRRGAAARS